MRAAFSAGPSVVLRFTVTTLPGLDHDTALALRDTLLRQDDGGDGDAV